MKRKKKAVGYGAMTIGARQKVALEVTGSRTVTWHWYWPGERRLIPRSKLSGVTPRREAALGTTAIGDVSSTSLPAEYRLTKATRGWVLGGVPEGDCL